MTHQFVRRAAGKEVATEKNWTVLHVCETQMYIVVFNGDIWDTVQFHLSLLLCYFDSDTKKLPSVFLCSVLLKYWLLL